MPRGDYEGSDLEATDPFQPHGAAIVAVTGEARGKRGKERGRRPSSQSLKGRACTRKRAGGRAGGRKAKIV